MGLGSYIFLFYTRLCGMLQQRQEAHADPAQDAQLPYEQRRVDASVEEEGADRNRTHRDDGDTEKPIERLFKLAGKVEQKFKLA